MGCFPSRHRRTPAALIQARKRHGPGVHAVVHATTIHETPDSNSPIVGHLKQWTHLIAMSEKNGWVQHALGWTNKYFENDSPCLLTIEDIYMVTSPTGVNCFDAPKAGANRITVLEYQEEVPCFGIRGEWIYHPFGWSLVRYDGKDMLKREVDEVNAGQEGQNDMYRVIGPPRGLSVRAVPDITSPVEDLLPVGTELSCAEIQGDWLRHTKGWSLIWGFETHHFVLYLEQIVGGAGGAASARPVVKPVQMACLKCKQQIYAQVPIAVDGSVTESIIACPLCDSRFRMKISQGPLEGQKKEGVGAELHNEDQIEGQASIELQSFDGERSPGSSPATSPRNTDGTAEVVGENESKRS